MAETDQEERKTSIRLRDCQMPAVHWPWLRLKRRLQNENGDKLHSNAGGRATTKGIQEDAH